MNAQREEPSPWAFWEEKDEPAADGKGRRFKLKCSTCLTELSYAVVFPEHGLRLCLSCLERINAGVKEKTSARVPVVEAEAIKVPSGQEATGPASLPVPSLSRDDTPSTEGER